MKRINTLQTLGAALVLSFAMGGNAHAAMGIQIDPDGLGIVNGSFALDETAFVLGNVLFDNCFSVANGTADDAQSCDMYAQSRLNNSAVSGLGFDPLTDIIHWGFWIPIEIWGTEVTIGPDTFQQVNIQSRAGETGLFQMWLDLDGDGVAPNFNTIGSSGKGFSEVGSDTVDADAILLLEGAIVLGDQNIPTGLFTMTNQSGTETECDKELDADGDCADASDKRTVLKQNSSYSALIDVTYQDTGYVVNDLVDTGFTLEGIAADVTNLAASLKGSSDEGNLVEFVAGIDASYGQSDASTDINDFGCEGGLGDALATCDYQALSKGSFKFRGDLVPEPGTLALIGGGLMLFGLARRRKATA